MKYDRAKTVRVAGELIALVVAGYLIYDFGVLRGREHAARSPDAADQKATPPADAPSKTGDIDPTTGKAVLYWHDPMVPGQRFDRPGQSPFMNMKLVPVYAGDGGDEIGVSVSARVQQNLGIRMAEATRRTIAPRVEVVGTVAFNERDQVIVQTRATAYIEVLHVRATLDHVSRGQPLAELYVPEWVAAQEELLSVRRMKGTDLDSLVDAARQRLRQVGMTDDQIRAVESRGTVQPRIALVAPIDGVVTELAAREGMTVTTGQTLFRINGLSTVWVNAAVPESQTASLRPGAPVKARSAAVPNLELGGTVQAILPDVDTVTRTIRARIELENRDLALAPGMFVTVSLGAEAAEALVVPSEAIIRTGTRTVVIGVDDSGGFHPVDVEVGAEADGNTEITRGLVARQKVVVSGQFLLDSEASLRATTTRMEDAPVPNGNPREHTGEGTITAIGDGTVTLSHGPIPSIEWGAMTMEFVLPPGGPPRNLARDQRVQFAFTIGSDGKPRLTRLDPIEVAQ